MFNDNFFMAHWQKMCCTRGGTFWSIYFVFCSLVTITCQNFMGNSMLFKPTCSCGSIYTHKTLQFLFYHCVYVINSYVPKHQIPGIVQGGISKQLSTSLYEQWSILISSISLFCLYNNEIIQWSFCPSFGWFFYTVESFNFI